MELCDILSKDIINLNVKGCTKDDVLRELSALLHSAGYISDIDQFMADIYVREAAGITGAGNHIAIPHGKSSVVCRNTIAIGRSRHDVPWESYDDEPVNLFFLFCVSDDESFTQNHMRLLAELAGKIGKDSLVAELQQASDPADVIAILTK
ncbi:fructose PTS transporter subunit IIA [Collinsella sp. zg1085]|uniref:PTS sugar transporter subunit IIA n=1 Tax=Collinsella sp. zg1085 TaxID=2844380 RepID=UPI001C0AC827|nr:fructose PTS transporter subunit IIA [Collinsella sp. zg1085]QWT17421.1 fructose PTS transporter subunit IIA [Collinsella sp. zg1085]